MIHVHHIVTWLEVFIINDAFPGGKTRRVSLAFVAVIYLVISPQTQTDILDLKAFVQDPDVAGKGCILRNGLAHATLLRGIIKEQIVLPAISLLLAQGIGQQSEVGFKGWLGHKGSTNAMLKLWEDEFALREIDALALVHLSIKSFFIQHQLIRRGSFCFALAFYDLAILIEGLLDQGFHLFGDIAEIGVSDDAGIRSKVISKAAKLFGEKAIVVLNAFKKAMLTHFGDDH